ncbi:MAG: glycosyltransferase family 4 protein [Candidatus Omnitrophota bacterium]
MKILLLANHLNAGGITTCLLTLGKEYVRRGHQVTIASSGGGCVAAAAAAGIGHLMVPELRVKCEYHPVLIRAVLTISRFVRVETVDILHAHTRVTQMVAAISGVTTHCPYVSTCHGFFKLRLSRFLFPLWGKTVVAISRAVVDHLVLAFKVPPERVVLVPNGIDAERFKPRSPAERLMIRERFGLNPGAPIVGTIGRLSDVKGQEYLIKAMDLLRRRIPGVKCFIVGEGPMEESLKSLVQSVGLELNVIFLPIMGFPEEVLPVFDVFAMPSLQEGLGLSVMEASACGIPVVASRVGGLVEAVNSGETGLLVPARDPDALAAALERLLLDKALAERLGSAGRRRIIADFSIAVMVDKTLDVYRKVVSLHA